MNGYGCVQHDHIYKIGDGSDLTHEPYPSNPITEGYNKAKSLFFEKRQIKWIKPSKTVKKKQRIQITNIRNEKRDITTEQ